MQSIDVSCVEGPAKRRAAAIFWACAGALLLWGFGTIAGGHLFWLPVAYSLPLVSTAVTVGLCVCAAKTRLTPAVIGLILWSVFATLLLLKLILFARLYHYGFALAVPAFVLLVPVLLDRVPRHLQLRKRGGWFFRAFCFVLFLCMLSSHWIASMDHYQQRTYPLGQDVDRIFFFDPAQDIRSEIVTQALSFVAPRLPADQTLAVLPEGAMLNFFLRRPASTPYISFMPPEIRAYGELTMLAALQAQPPDFILLTSREMQEYGVPPFGRSPLYGKLILDWIRTAYRSQAVFLPQHQSTSAPFTIEVLQYVSP